MAVPQKPMLLWQVEKFVPLFCPKCNRKFSRQNHDFIIFLGDIVEGSKVPRKTPGYDIIVCKHCKNFTARVWLQVRTVSKKKEAEDLTKEDGFTNVHSIEAFGVDTEPTVHIFNEHIVGPTVIHPHWSPENFGPNIVS